VRPVGCGSPAGFLRDCGYGMNTLFERHLELIQTLYQEASGLSVILSDGWIRRSGVTETVPRRVYYYVTHRRVDQHGVFSRATE